MVLVLLRGDHRLNEIKLRNGMKTDFRQASAEEIEAELGPVGYLGPVGQRPADHQGRGDRPATPTSPAPTRPNTHLRGIDPARDFESYEMDVRTVEAGDTAPGGGTIEIEPAIEVGNIFKLGTRYSEPLGATYLDEDGVGAADRDGQLRDRPGADRRRRDRAARRRARDRLAARRSRPGRSTSSRSPRPASPSARPPTSSTRSCARPASRSSTTTATPGRGRS